MSPKLYLKIKYRVVIIYQNQEDVQVKIMLTLLQIFMENNGYFLGYSLSFFVRVYYNVFDRKRKGGTNHE